MKATEGFRLTMAAVVAAVACMAGGCSWRPADQPPLGRVRGVVTMDGRPLSGVDVVFCPEKGRPSVATTDAAGRYDLTYVNVTKGAKVGRHKVSISPTDLAGGDAPSARRVPQPTARVTIPAKYNSRSTLSAEVKAGSNTIDFPLESR